MQTFVSKVMSLLFNIVCGFVKSWLCFLYRLSLLLLLLSHVSCV